MGRIIANPAQRRAVSVRDRGGSLRVCTRSNANITSKVPKAREKQRFSEKTISDFFTQKETRPPLAGAVGIWHPAVHRQDALLTRGGGFLVKSHHLHR